MVLVPSGQLRATTCSLNKRLDTLRIVRGKKIRRIPLADISYIYAGQEPEGITTPVDDLCATVELASDQTLLTFRCEHINARDVFIMCLTLFKQSLCPVEYEDNEAWDENAFDCEEENSEYQINHL